MQLFAELLHDFLQDFLLAFLLLPRKRYMEGADSRSYLHDEAQTGKQGPVPPASDA